jgi:subtilisin family serine protease
MKLLTAFLLCLLWATTGSAQYQVYRVQLKHKGATNFLLSQPQEYLSTRAIDRRNRYLIPVDSSDLPIPEAYIQQIQAIPNLTLLNQSRWLNAVSIRSTDAAAISALQNLPFVASVEGIAARPVAGRDKLMNTESPAPFARPMDQQEDYFNYGNGSFSEINLHKGQFLHNLGLQGQGIHIAMLDGGFRNFTSLPAFDSMNANGQVLSTWDFVARESSVSEDHPHGMQCLSTIAANIPGQFVGKAPKASFHLFRTEDVASEYPIEEFNWVCAAERADSIGADIISSSLGYGYQWSSPVADYPYSFMDGNTTMAARGADMAAAKGILVFNSAGNSGNDYWKFITTPADGDSVVAVAAVNNNGMVGSFSSYGPSADGRIKPDLASVGVAAMIQSTSGFVATSNGTSFACPNLAGLASCLWQAFPEFNNMRIIRALKESAHQYNAPDDRTGYGIPDMKEAFGLLLKEYSHAMAEVELCDITISWSSKDLKGMYYILERRHESEPGFTQFMIAPHNVSSNRLTSHSYGTRFPFTDWGTGNFEIRIGQVIDTSQAGYSVVYLDTVSLLLENPCLSSEGPYIRLLGNPVQSSGQVLLQIYSENAVDDMRIEVYNATGQLLYRQRKAKQPGMAFEWIPYQSWVAGVYFIRVMDGKKTLGKTTLLRQ